VTIITHIKKRKTCQLQKTPKKTNKKHTPEKQNTAKDETRTKREIHPREPKQKQE